MRILISAHGASLFGAERVLLAQAAGLAARGHDVTVEIPHAGPALDAARALPGVTVWHSRRPRLPRNGREFVRYVVGAPLAFWRLVRHCRRARYDCVWVHTAFNPLPAFAARVAGIPVVWHTHERNRPGLLGAAIAVALRMAATRTLAVSEFCRPTYGGYPWMRGRVSVLHSPLTRTIPPLTDAERARPTARPFTVGFVGRFDAQKRPTDLVDAIARVPGVVALLVGDGRGRAEVEQRIATTNTADRIQIAGFHPDVRPFYAAMDCFVLPSKDEACALVLLEAMALGIPVLAARSGGSPEVLQDAGLLYPVGDPDALAALITHVRDDAPRRAQLVAAGQQRVQYFALETWLDRVETLLHSL